MTVGGSDFEVADVQDRIAAVNWNQKVVHEDRRLAHIWYPLEMTSTSRMSPRAERVTLSKMWLFEIRSESVLTAT